MTWMLSILSGHWRYAHVSAIRADGVNPGLLGMSAVVAEDTLRRGLKAIDERAGTQWLWRHIGRTVLGLLEVPRIHSMSLRTNGVGVDLPPRIWRAVGCQHHPDHDTAQYVAPV